MLVGAPSVSVAIPKGPYISQLSQYSSPLISWCAAHKKEIAVGIGATIIAAACLRMMRVYKASSVAIVPSQPTAKPAVQENQEKVSRDCMSSCEPEHADAENSSPIALG
jgi:hypothetical protein